MTFLEKLSTIERLDQLIRLQATGTPNALSNKLGVSRKTIYNLIDLMKAMDAPVEYCVKNQSFYYAYDCELMIGFVDKNKIRGGTNVKKQKNYWGVNFLHNQLIPLQHNRDLGIFSKPFERGDNFQE